MLALIFYTLLTLIVTFPLIFNLNSLIIDRYDGLLLTWIINWNIHSFSNLSHYFNTNIFFPYTNTLAFSDYHLLHGLIAWPFISLFKEPLLAFNINFLLGFILTSWSTYLLSFHLTKNTRASLLAGTLFGFGIIHLNYSTHLQLFDFYILIFALLALFQKKYKSFILCFFLAVLNMPLYLYFLLTILTLFWFYFPASRRSVFFSTFIALFLVAHFLLPFYFVSRHFNYTRPIQDVIHFSLKYSDLWLISPFSRLHALLPQNIPSTPAFPGVIFSLLLLLTALTKLKMDKLTKFFLSLAAISFVFAFGPAFHLFSNTVHIGPLPALPLPYLLFYYVVPGFAAFRTPSRWILLTFFALAIVVGRHFSRKLTNRSLIILLLAIIAEINFPFHYAQVPSLKDFPPEQLWLSSHFATSPLIQFPIYGWWNSPGLGQETLREYYSTIHYHPMYNGYSGFSPREWENRVIWLQNNFPGDEAVGYLKSQKIKLLLAPISWSSRLASQSGLKLVQKFPNTAVYEIL